MLDILNSIAQEFMRYTWLKVLIPAALSLYSVHWIFMRVLNIAKQKNLVDNPNARKLQKTPVPLLGGIAVFFGVLMGVLFASCYLDGFSDLLPVFLAASIMLYIGTIDDLLGLTPFIRIVFESLAVLGLIFGSGLCVNSLHGLWGIGHFSWWIGVPITVFAGVGIINAYNMVDGVNGLSSGLCIVGSVLMGIFFTKCGSFANAVLAFTFAASLSPFTMHNVFGKKSRMYIGDAGTMVMGLLVTWFVIKSMSFGGVASVRDARVTVRLGYAALMLAIASVPVADTLRVMLGRIFHGKSPFEADRTHLHHVFIDLGISHSITSLSEIFINFLITAIWYASYKLGMPIDIQLYVVIVSAAIFVVGTYYFLRYHMKNNTRSLQRIEKFSISTHFGHREWWQSLQRYLDKGACDDSEIEKTEESKA